LVVEGVAQWGVGITYCRGREIYRGKAERENEKKRLQNCIFVVEQRNKETEMECKSRVTISLS